MKRQLVVIYDTDNKLNGLVVVDPEEVLENGNFKVIKILLGDYADEVYRDLTETSFRRFRRLSRLLSFLR